MNIRNPFHVVFFFLIASVVIWLSLATAHGFFVRSVPQASHYCNKWEKIPDGVDSPERLAGSLTRCVDFISTLEHLKYYHNLGAVKRSGLLFNVAMGIGFVLPFCLFYILPTWRQTLVAHEQESIGGAFLLGLVLAFSPWLLSTILPPPSQWAPETINRYFETRNTEALNELIEIAAELDDRQQDDQ